MTKDKFRELVTETLEEVLQVAEQRAGKKLPRSVVFVGWARRRTQYATGIVDEIIGRVYLDEAHIRPCVDIGVGDLLDDGTPVIVANVAGYPPGPFGKNWTGEEGPFIPIIGQRFLDKITGKTK